MPAEGTGSARKEENQIERWEHTAMVTKESVDDTLITAGEAEAVAKPDNTAETSVLPDFIKTRSGIGITFYDRKKLFPIRVRYGSTVSSCLVEAPSVEPGPILEKLMEVGFIEEKDGGFNQEITVPVELITLPNGENCAVLVTDLSNCTKGLTNLQTQETVTVSKLFGMLSKQANAVACLEDNGIYLQKWDGQAFYFNTGFGVFALVLDGQLLSDDTKLNEEGAVDKTLAATLLYQLTGAYPTVGDGKPYGTLIEAQEEPVICFDGVERSIHTKDPVAETFWNGLPRKLREAFEDCFFALDCPAPDARKWAQLFTELAETVEGESCFNCNKMVFSGASVCPHCGGNLDKRQLLSKWLVVNDTSPYKYGFVLPVNMLLDSAMLAPNHPKGNSMRMVYSAKRNLLALQNLGSSVLSVDYGNLGQIEAEPQSLFALKSGMKITGSQLQGITLKLLGFERKDSWEVDKIV